jgi:cation:H+ antiporter
MPELYIAIISGIKKVPDIAVGALVGSNIAHISLVVGIAAIIKPFRINKGLKNSDVFIFFITSFIATLLLWNNQLTKIKGLILLLSFLAAFGWIIIKEVVTVKSKKSFRNIYIEYPFKRESTNLTNILISILWITFGIVALHISSHFVIESAQNISKLFGITNLSVGLLLLGLGTNLPELAIMLASIYNNERDLALGGVIGANIFGITFALGLSGIISPTKLPEVFNIRDLTSMMLLTIIFSLLLLNHRKIISRIHGVVLVILYVVYLTTTTSSNALVGA